MSVITDNYSLGASDAELQRLVELASREEDRVVDACRRAGVGSGATVVDIGCGPLGALKALSEVVGPHGMVVGVDGSASALEKARSLLPVSRYPQLRFVRSHWNTLAKTPKTLAVSLPF